MLVLGLAAGCGGPACPTAEEQTYLAAVPILHEEAAAGAETASGLIAAASADPQLVAAETWKSDVAVAQSRMETGANAIADSGALESLSRIDRLNKTSATRMLEAVGLYRGAASAGGRPDPAAMEVAVLLASAAHDRAEAAAAAERFCDEPQ